MASTACDNMEANKEIVKGTTNQIRKNAIVCPIETEVPSSTASFSPTEANKARARSNPAMSPTIDDSCFMNPLVKPSIAPMNIIPIIAKSRVVILLIKIMSF